MAVTPTPTLGRRTLLDADRMQKILEALSAGNSIDVASRYAKIDRATFYRWHARGRAERARIDALIDEDPTAEPKPLETEAIYYDFCDEVETARNAAEMRAVTIIRRSAEGFTQTERRTETKQTGVDRNGQPVFSTTEIVTEKQSQSWQAAAWYLERLRPAEYGRTMRVEGNASAPLRIQGDIRHEHVLADESPTGLAGILDALAEVRGDHPALDGIRAIEAAVLADPEMDGIHSAPTVSEAGSVPEPE